MTIEQATESLKHNFGFNSFRPMQEDVVKAILNGQDCLVLMPTGGGKSLCYQLPATILPGVTIVVSPLIALMKDQVESLVENGVKASFINSSIPFEEIEDIKRDVQSGKIKLLYVSPEKLVSHEFQSFLKSIQISLFAIDEAHCISSWGHDFRQEYTKLKTLKKQYPQIPIIALTATADKLTRRDIITQLTLNNHATFISSFDRPNLRLTVLPAKKRMSRIVEFIQKRKNESGIIYCLSRKQTERVAYTLQDEGIGAEYYHAGMDSFERSRVQENFVHGRTPVIVATIAFGMGIDKSNVRYVIHHNLPKNIEGYYQEIGRAGRDGLPSETLLFYSLADVILLRSFAQESGQSELQLAKLQRMQQYADALICRRKILLTYFGEHTEKNCGNCDVCENPPELFDGTDIVQKALSALYRLNEQVGTHMLIDVLRGSTRQEITEHGYDKIKTYGVGKNISPPNWEQYLLQMLNLGLIDIAYDEHNTLKITPAGKEVLVGKKQVQLVTLESIEDRIFEFTSPEIKKSKRKTHEEELFDCLRELRLSIARQTNVPPYIVFTDATLDEMTRRMPTTESAMKQISGVGDKKFDSYGKLFIDEITKFVQLKDKAGEKVQGTTQDITFAYYRQGMPVAQIARERNLKEQTIYSHLAELYEQGHEMKITDFLDKSTLKKITESLQTHGVPDKLKTLYERFDGKIEYHQLKMAIAHYKVNFAEKGVIRYN